MHWLLQIAVSPDLIRDGLRIVADELTHSELSFGAYRAAGGEVPPTLDIAALQFSVDPERTLEQSTLLTTVRVFCLGETVAVPLFRRLRGACTQPVARQALDRITDDEGRHREFGWDLLDELVARMGRDNVKLIVEPQLPAMWRELDSSYGRGAVDRDGETFDDSDRSWGVIAPSEYEQILLETMTRVWVPRFARLDMTFPS